MRIIIESTERRGAEAPVYEATQPVYVEEIEAGAAVEGPGGFGLVSLEGGAADAVETEDSGGFGMVSFEGGETEMAEGPGGFGGAYLGSGGPQETETGDSDGFGGASLT